MKRPYTGNKDGLAKGATSGLVALVKEITTYSQGALWNNGTFVNRPMRGKESLSVHATGRAWRCDRDAWQIYSKETVHGTPNGDWFHVEVSPQMSQKPQVISAVFTEKFPVA